MNDSTRKIKYLQKYLCKKSKLKLIKKIKINRKKTQLNSTILNRTGCLKEIKNK